MEHIQTIQLSAETLELAKTFLIKDNYWQTLYAALLGALAGGLCPIFVNFVDRLLIKSSLKKSTTCQITSEISAILKIIEKRKFIEGFKVIQNDFINHKKIIDYTYIQITLDVSPIYKANLHNLGLLDAEYQSKIVQFYRYLDSLIEDVKQGGSFSKGFGLEECSAFIELAEETISLGHEIANKLTEK